MLITGTIKDKATGESLPFANVFFAGPDGKYQAGTPGTITDFSGNYTLQGNGSHVTASYTGYKPQTKAAAPTLNFDLATDANLLPEVIVSAKMVWPRVLAAIIILVTLYFSIKYFIK